MPKVAGRQDPVTPQEVAHQIRTQIGGGPLVTDYMATMYRRDGVRGSKAELRRMVQGHVEMMRYSSSAEDFDRFVADVTTFHNDRLDAAQRGDIRAKYAHMF